MEAIYQSDTKLCVYTRYDNDLHCFTFYPSEHDTNAMRQTVEEWHHLLKGVFHDSMREHPPVLRTLYDTRGIKSLPLKLMIHSTKEAMAAYPRRPPTLSAILAKQIPIITTSISVVVPIFRRFGRPGDETKFFWLDRDAAIQWLTTYPVG
jgi:hypothetical protein